MIGRTYEIPLLVVIKFFYLPNLTVVEYVCIIKDSINLSTYLCLVNSKVKTNFDINSDILYLHNYP